MYNVIIFVYAPAKKEFKKEFWLELINYTLTLSLPFVIIGDYNEISNTDDKKGSAPISSNRFTTMKQILSQL